MNGIEYKNDNYTTYSQTVPLAAGKSYHIACPGGDTYDGEYTDKYTLSVDKTDCRTLSSTPVTYYRSEEYFQYIPLTSGWYTFATSTEGYITLYDSAFTWLDMESTTEELGLSAYLIAGEPYYILFSALDGLAGSISCASSTFPAITPEFSQPVPLGNGAISYLTFVPTTTEEYTITATIPEDTDNIHGVYVFSETGVQLAGEGDKAPVASFSTTYSFTAGQTYYLGIDGYAGNGADRAIVSVIPGSGGEVDPPPTSKHAQILALYPTDGADDVGYSEVDRPGFQITFDRAILSMRADNGALFPELDFSKGTLKIFRASDDRLIYQVEHDEWMNTIYDELEGTTSGDTDVRGNETLVIDPISANAPLTANTEYYITLDEGFIRFEDGTVNPAIEKDDWTFKTMEESSPVIKKEGDFYFSSGITGSTSASYTYAYDESWFFMDSYTYNHELARMSLCAAMSAFDIGGKDRAANIKDLMDDLGFTYTEESIHYPTPTSDSIGYAIGSKNIRSASGETTTVLLVAIRGGGYGAEWVSNFTVGTTLNHQGFSNAADQVIEGIESYLESTPHNSEVKIWITGYSRAAATANIAAARLDHSANKGEIPGLSPSGIYAYCFECPRTSIYGTQSELYNNIFSIVNHIDLVTKVAPGDWGYGRYGISYVLPVVSKATENNATQREMRQEYENIYRSIGGNTNFDPSVKELTDQIFGQGYWADKMISLVAGVFGDSYTYASDWEDLIRDGVNFAADYGDTFTMFMGMFGDIKTIVDFTRHPIKTTVTTAASVLTKDELQNLKYAHYPELCLAWMNSLSGKESYQKLGYRVLLVNCPVDVTVYDADGEKFLSIEDRIVSDSVDERAGTYIDENGQMIIFLPSDDSYEIEMEATDTGTVTYTIAEVDLSVDQMNRVVSYHNIPVVAGDVLNGPIEDLEEVSSVQYSLTKNRTEEIEPTVDQQGGSVEKYTVSINVNGNGTAKGSGSYISGEHVQLAAVPDRNETFLGWYDGKKLLSQEMEYRLLVDHNLTLTAVFTGETESTDRPSRPNGSEESYPVSTVVSDNGEIDVDPIRAQEGDDVTITATPDDGYELDTLTVTDRDGDEIRVTENRDGTYSFVMPDSQVTIEATFAPVEEDAVPEIPTDWVNPYTDVASGAWYYDAVAYVTVNGLMNGTSATTFAPNVTTTRAMIWTVLARMNGQSVDGGTPWYALAQSWAVTANVSDGTNPENPISREELATMLYRAAGSPAVSGNLLSYPDGSSVSAWAENAMLWATQNGIISGIDGMLTPQGQATRAQVATMLMRFREAI